MTFRVSHKQMKAFFQQKKFQGTIAHYTAGKYTMEYVHAGDSTHPMVLFVHGSPGSLSAFLGYVADSTLRSRAFVVTADRPGFGHSNFGVGEPSLQKQGAVLKQIIDRHAHARPVVLVGHSLGGPLIARMAIDYPDDIAALVMVAGSIDPQLEPNEAWFRAPLATPFLSWILPRSLRASNDELYQLKPELEELIPLWKNITCPVVVIHGEKDELVPFENVAFAEKMLTGSTVHYILLDDAGHFIPWQRHDVVVEGVLKALEMSRVPDQRATR